MKSIQLKKIVIPIIQRDYAQGRTDPDVTRIRTRFLDALYDALTVNPVTLDFVYGNINEDGEMTPLDGQQRLTTLFLLHWYAAKKDRIDREEYRFLENFSYETRYSARYFCTELVEFEPSFGGKLSDEIINQPWFPLDWKKDPTISSMLVMINDIDDKFSEMPDLWEKLKGGAISFYFLPIKDMGLTDELYIKMNSRGKPLTMFEHFKAELEKELSVIDEKSAKRIISKFDCEWMDLFWKYRDGKKGTDDDDTTDDEFLNYFKFVCDVISYRLGESLQGQSSDEFDLIQKHFSKDNEKALQNMETLEKFFDCWLDIPGQRTPAAFLEDYMSAEHEDGKIKVDSRYREKIDIFEDCLHSYSGASGRMRMFPLNRFVMLFALNCFLQNKDSITEDEFRRRLRIINNLIQNSEDQIADRTDRNRIPAILEQTENIMMTGAVDGSIDNGFNVNQLREERDKIAFLQENPDKKNKLFALEDHNLLHGQIGIIGTDHIDLSERFKSLFECSKDKIDCALMTVGNYGQVERNGWRYQFGSGRGVLPWDALFHRSFNKRFDNTKNVLVNLLEMHESFDDEILDRITEDYVKTCEENSQFPWRYYYIKYPEFRPGSFGKYAMMSNEYNEYMFAVMQTRSHISENTYMPYLKAADAGHIDRDNYGMRLAYKNHHIICRKSSFIVKSNDEGKVIETIDIKQNENGFDTEDRIIKLKTYLQAHTDL